MGKYLDIRLEDLLDTPPSEPNDVPIIGDTSQPSGWAAQYPAGINTMFDKPTAATYQNIERIGSTFANLAGVLTSGTLLCSAIVLPRGLTVSNVSFYSGTTAGVTMTHWWFALLDAGLVVRAVSADQTNGAITANTLLTLAMATPYVTTAAGLYYCGIMVAASTPPTLIGVAGHATVAGAAPVLVGASTTGMTTPPATGGAAQTALTAGASTPYCYVS